MKPSIGRIVIYKTTQVERDHMQSLSNSGVPTNISSELPAIIVAVWSENCINVKVIVDGRQQDILKTSISFGENEGQLHWPERV